MKVISFHFLWHIADSMTDITPHLSIIVSCSFFILDNEFMIPSLDMICSAIAKGHDCEKILRNLRFIRPDGTLTVAAMLLFGKYTQRWMPMMTAKCICFAGNSVGSKVFRDKVNDAEMEGNLLHQYDTIMDFFTRNLHNVQVGDEFNSMGKLEIPYTSLVEFTVNSLVHRSLNMKVPVRIFIFDNRVEIHSPGAVSYTHLRAHETIG